MQYLIVHVGAAGDCHNSAVGESGHVHRLMLVSCAYIDDLAKSRPMSDEAAATVILVIASPLKIYSNAQTYAQIVGCNFFNNNW